MNMMLKIPGKLNLVTVLILSSLTMNAYADDVYKFNNNLLMGGKKVDLSKYTTSSIAEGVYSLDVYTNGEWKGRHELAVKKQKDGKMGICYDAAMLVKFGVSADRINPSLAKKDGFCGELKEWSDSKDVHDTIAKGTLRLDIVIPQIYQDQTYRDYVDPSLWETGIPALNVGWNGNIWNTHYSAAGGSNSTTGYLGIDAIASVGGWTLRHQGNLSWSDKESAKWDSSKTYLQRPIPKINSIASVGQINGTGEFFDSVTVRGVDLRTDDSMYPDGVMSFAPEIRGEARTNALVTVKQNGSIIHQVTVAPGPFVLTDVYPNGYGNNLEVSVKESDGTVTYFVVPYNATSKLLRPGLFRYDMLVGKADDSYLRNKPVVYQGTAQYGINNILTGYVGFSGFNNYQSYLVGTGISTPIGAFSLDVTTSNLKVDGHTDKGNMYRASYVRSFDETGTTVSMTGIKYSDKGFYNLSNALSANDYTWRRYADEKSNISMSLNQTFPEGWGSIYATGRLVEYWDGYKKNKQYQVGYNNRFGKLSYTVSAQRAMYTTGGSNKTDDRISLNFSLPLNFSEDHSATVTSYTTVNNSRYSSTQVGLNGSVGDRHDFTYGVNTSVGDVKNVSLNAGYRSPWATLNGSFGQGSNYRQTSVSGSGSLVAHSGGIIASPEMGDTIAIVEAKGANGARIASSLGAEINSDGYGVVTSLRPYRVNNIGIDPKGSSDNVYFHETMKQVVPYEGSIVKVSFDTEVQDNLMFKGMFKDGKPFPFGSSVYNAKGKEIGTVGQGGGVFIKDASQAKATVKWKNGSCSFTLPKESNSEVVCS